MSVLKIPTETIDMAILKTPPCNGGQYLSSALESRAKMLTYRLVDVHHCMDIRVSMSPTLERSVIKGVLFGQGLKINCRASSGNESYREVILLCEGTDTCMKCRA